MPEHGAVPRRKCSDQFGVPRQTILALEAGRYSPALLMSLQIARAFGIEDVFGFEDDSESVTGR